MKSASAFLVSLGLAWGGIPFAAPAGSSYQIVFAGDSLTYSSPFGPASPSSYPYVLCHTYTSCTYVNTGISGSTSSDVLGRYASDVTANNPKYLVIMMGTNDAAYGTNQAAVDLFISNYTTILNSCVSAGILPVVVLIPPNSAATTAMATFYDNANSALVTLLNSYPAHVLIDPRSTLGQFRSGGTDGNLWDLQAAYNGDGTHFTQAGYAKVAELVWTGINTSEHLNKYIYVAQAAAGADTGASCAAAHSATWFNTSGNWGAAATVAPGDTVHLCGTFTGTGGSTMLTVQASGTSGNPITVLWETDAILTAPYWGVTGAIRCSGKSYITIDGGSNGIIRNSANGDALANQQNSQGVSVDGCDNITVRRLNVQTIYVHTQDANQSGGVYSAAFSTTAISINQSSNALVELNTTTDSSTAIGFGGDTGTVAGFEARDNNMTNCNRCLVVGVATSTLQNVLLHDNDFGGGAYLWDQPDNAYHHNAIHVFNTTSGHINNLQIYNNYVHGVWGADTNSNHTTSMFFVETVNPASGSAALIFNNVLVGANRYSMPTNGYVFCKSNTAACEVYGNVFTGVNDGSHYGTAMTCSAPQPMTIKNNIVQYMGAYYTCTWTAVDYNIYNDVSAWDGYGTFAAWQGAGYDANGLSSNPNLDATSKPQFGSSAIGAGVNLSALGITALNSDKNGVARGSAWDIGAYEFTPPTTLRGTVRGATIK